MLCCFTLGCRVFYRSKKAIECEGIRTSWLLSLWSWVYPDYSAIYSLSLFLGSVCYFVCSVCSECKEGEPLSASFGNLRDLKPGVLTGKWYWWRWWLHGHMNEFWPSSTPTCNHSSYCQHLWQLKHLRWHYSPFNWHHCVLHFHYLCYHHYHMYCLQNLCCSPHHGAWRKEWCFLYHYMVN